MVQGTLLGRLQVEEKRNAVRWIITPLHQSKGPSLFYKTIERRKRSMLHSVVIQENEGSFS